MFLSMRWIVIGATIEPARAVCVAACIA